MLYAYGKRRRRWSTLRGDDGSGRRRLWRRAARRPRMAQSETGAGGARERRLDGPLILARLAALDFGGALQRSESGVWERRVVWN